VAVDLHTHSTFSDGSDRPGQIVDAAVVAALTAIALTDHDGIDGIEEAAASAAGRIELIPGVELSVRWHDHAMHLLGYWIGPGTAIAAALHSLQESRAVRNTEMIAALVELGIDITVEELAAQAGVDGVGGRPHIAAVLVSKGVVDSIPQAFDHYLAAGRPAYRGRLRLDAGEAVDLIHRSGGVAVVAHPHTIADDEGGFRDLFESLAGLGVDGIECHYAEYEPALRDRLAARARALDLVPTGGSDYHGTYKPGLELGRGFGDLVVPDEVVPALRERRTEG
jgi:3',5'-nucleoside bisphosphate phosphatase